MYYLLWIACFFVSPALNAVSQEIVTYQVDAYQNNFSVQLPSNPTTGYQWVIKQYDQKLLKLNASQFVKPTSRLMGASGTMIFNFSVIEGAVRPQATLIQLVYRRPWEPNTTGNQQTVIVNFPRSQ